MCNASLGCAEYGDLANYTAGPSTIEDSARDEGSGRREQIAPGNIWRVSPQPAPQKGLESNASRRGEALLCGLPSI
jgi:hypothetical protein